MMTIPLMTFTGIDGKTPTGWINGITRKYRQGSGYAPIEFAILRSPKVGQSPRYPTRDQIRAITSYVYPEHLAFHLCGRYARMVFTLEWAELCDIIDFELVHRVQVNSTECDEKAMITLQRFSAYIKKPVIMQWRGDEFPLVPNIHLLQDRSGGKGIVETNWISPDPVCRRTRSGVFGYAGGLSPENISSKIPDIQEAAKKHPFWIDCESGVRTNDWFDTDKAEAMIQAAISAGLGIVEHAS